MLSTLRSIITRSNFISKRSFSSSTFQSHTKSNNDKKNDHLLTVHFMTPEDGKQTVTCHEGDSLLEVAHENEIELEGACEGSLACSTCHVVVEPKYYAKLDEPSDEENDMLDLAFGLTDTSRLGCQIKMCKELDNITVTIPSATRNMAVDGKPIEAKRIN